MNPVWCLFNTRVFTVLGDSDKDPFPVELFESPIIKTSIDFQLYQWQHGGGVHAGFFFFLMPT